MANIFQKEVGRRYPRTRFNLNHEVKTTMRFGNITPIMCREILPGDTWKCSVEQLIRFSPLLSPVMHRINTYVHYFFVPNRLIMGDLWEDFISPNGLSDEERPNLPYLVFDLKNHLTTDYDELFVDLWNTVISIGGLCDHIGINLQHLESASITEDGVQGPKILISTEFIEVPLLPILAYWMIMEEYFIDENYDYNEVLTDYRSVKKFLKEIGQSGYIRTSTLDQDGYNKMIELFKLCKRCFEKDYFTSALPNTQRGGDVLLGGVQKLDAYVSTKDIEVDHFDSRVSEGVGDVPIVSPSAYETGSDEHGIDMFSATSGVTTTTRASIKAKETMLPVTDEEGEELNINPISVNELRRATKLQEFLEKSMRGGYRLIEQIRAHFGVISSDARLDRPEFLGGTSNPVTVSELSATNSSDTTFLGEYSGRATAFGGSRVVKRRFEEHGWLFCLVSVLPRTAYCQGLDRQFFRKDRFDFAWPEFAHLGEQPVFNKELYYDDPISGPEANDDTFGYQSRYAEYKYIPSQVSGDFKKSLDYWTMVRKFEEMPTLSQMFNQVDPADPNFTRIFTVQDGSDYLYCQFYHKISAKRELPKFGVPML